VRDVEFSRGKPALPDGADEILDPVANAMRDHQEYYAFLEAHSLKTGDAAANQALGEIRAGNMKKYLVDKGVAADHLRTRWVPSGEGNLGRVVLLKKP
jgi:outer membrane protein OmpA-like peptidoglycan-associated protein